ncbi:DUF1501 domain-containing protein [uncultured Gimesia sp.]|uniref:DUF1501 domain-containing protein n=1 Tax=uncultured Gimesia sp. TaxID=1678688 RepID=UPI0030D848BE|tara:strand:- start:28788 stop:30161 length:1374 start_codon:yes stop_codon:yes gene_type:complete
MLTILGKPTAKNGQFCDGVSRRSFLKIGGMALGGISLPGALQAETANKTGSNHKAIINIYLPGGPSHIDLWDPKPEAPTEIRGEFNAIPTNVPGIQISELFPRMAAMMDKFIPVRSISDADGRHDAYQCMTGRKFGSRQPPGGWPAAGAFVSNLQGPVNAAVPSNVALMYKTGNGTWGEPGTGGFLGVQHAPFNLVGRKARSSPENMVLQGITLERLRDRVKLQRAFDTFRREADTSGLMESMDVYAQQAMNILTTPQLADALDLSKEDPQILARYGKSDETFQRDGAPRMIENFCLARRLVEAGARFVSLNYSRWDWHGPDGMNFPKSREEFPLLDQGLSALVTDLHERGLDKDVSVVVWGEFGRTPKINQNNSRDHWPKVSCAMLAGGGMHAGQVIGKTNRKGEYAIDRPIKFQEVFATLYHNIGLDLNGTRIFDTSGTPQYLVDQGNEPIRELI